ncbi:MAG: DUF3313 family protein [Steroidobacteraceae bacterium]
MKPPTRKPAHRLAIAAAALALFASIGLAAAAELTDDGLEPIHVRDIDKAYKRPGASLAGYDRVLLKPATVEFSKSWDPRDYGGPGGLKPQEVDKLRNDLAKLADDTFRRVLEKGGYGVVAKPDAGVLEVEPHIVDLYINAPDVVTADIRHNYVLSMGEMRLNATLRDAVTGTVLYRTSDRKRDPETGRLEWANNVWNQAEAARMLAGWATQLKRALDAAKERQPAP